MDDPVSTPSFLKWAGGKRNLLRDLSKLFPNKIERYFEPFLGGGSIFFYVKQVYDPRYCLISDVNKDLILTYRAVRDDLDRLIYHLEYFRKKDSRNFYYKTRNNFNKHKIRRIRRCAAFIYLNKTCFNGLYRVNSKNEFNVPYAGYTNPEIFNESKLQLASQLLQGVEIRVLDYRSILTHTQKNDFVYLDPCYDPIKRTSFDEYTPKRFCINDRIELSKFINGLKSKTVNVLLSNNDLPEIRKLYEDFNINEIKAHRFINSKGEGRGKITELAIRNFDGFFTR